MLWADVKGLAQQATRRSDGPSGEPNLPRRKGEGLQALGLVPGFVRLAIHTVGFNHRKSPALVAGIISVVIDTAT